MSAVVSHVPVPPVPGAAPLTSQVRFACARAGPTEARMASNASTEQRMPLRLDLGTSGNIDVGDRAVLKVPAGVHRSRGESIPGRALAHPSADRSREMAW